MSTGTDPATRAPAPTRVRTLARKQADDEMIEGVLVADYGMTETEARDLIGTVAMELQHIRWAGQADLAEALWDNGAGAIGPKMTGVQLSTATALAYQHASWAREGSVGQAAKIIRETERQAARTKQGGPKGPTGVVAG